MTLYVCGRVAFVDNFYKDMGPRPEGKSLDRINNELGYRKFNCRWATQMEQVNNRQPSTDWTFEDEEEFFWKTMPRKYSPTAKRKRDQAFLKNLAQRENPIRYLVFLPVDVSDLNGISWKPTREEILLERLRAMQATWEREDIERRRRRAAEIAADVSRDIDWLERVNAIQREQQRVENYWLEERKKTADAIHKAQLKRLAQINEDIRKSDARIERQELLKRGVVRGRKSA
jgi:hypothetical protein